MAYATGITNDFWSKYYQRRAQKGSGLSASEMATLYEPTLAYEYNKSLAAAERERQQANIDRQLDLQAQRDKDAAAAAKVSGATSLVGTGANLYLGKKMLDIYSGGKTASAASHASATSGGFAGGDIGMGPAFSEAPTIEMTKDLSGAYSAAPGAANAGSATPFVAGEGAQAAFSAPAAEEASLAAYDAALAEGAAEGVGSTAATGTAAGEAGAAGAGAGTGFGSSVGSTVGPIAGYGYLGYMGQRANTRLLRPELEKYFGPNVSSHAQYTEVSLISGAIGDIIGGKAGKTVTDILDPVGWSSPSVHRVVDKATGTVICTELHRQGIIPERMRRVGILFAARSGYEAYCGYRVLADPVVERMRRSKRYTRFVALIAVPAIKEMECRIGHSDRGTVIGKAVLSIGVPLCRWMYRRGMALQMSEVA